MSLSRRDFLKITALAGAAVGLSAPLVHHFINQGTLKKISATHYLMGTVVNFVLIAESKDEAQTALQITIEHMRHLIQIYDHRQLDGPLGQLNATGTTLHPPHELVTTLQQSLRFGALSNGAFDVTIKPILDALQANHPSVQDLTSLVDYRLLNVTDDKITLARPDMAVTLDGIAKGCVIDGGVAMLYKLGFENVLVEAGGDMMAKSTQNGEVWQVGITHPRSPKETIAVISIQNQAVATSGDYMNFFSSDYSTHHIIDPHTGRSPSQLASATVIAANVADADALSTTMMVLGVQDGLALVENLPDASALLISKDMHIYRSSKFPVG